MKALIIRNWIVPTAFAGAVILATSPLWQRLLFGFDPTLDELLKLAMCGAPGR